MQYNVSTHAYRELDRDLKHYATAGAIGSIGDNNGLIKKAGTGPGNFRVDRTSSFVNPNIDDGRVGIYPETRYSPLIYDRKGPIEKIENYGYEYKGFYEPDVVPQLQWDWKNRIAKAFELKGSNYFTIPKGGLLKGPQGLLRGGNFPVYTTITPPSLGPYPFNDARVVGVHLDSADIQRRYRTDFPGRQGYNNQVQRGMSYKPQPSS